MRCMTGMRTWLTLSLATLAVTACASESHPATADTVASLTSVTPITPTPAVPGTPAEVQLTALLKGRLSFDTAGGCYFLKRPDNGVGFSVIWPSDMTPAGDGSGIHAPSWIPVGSIVTGGGGVFSSQPTPSFDDRTPCLVGSSEVLIFNPTASLTATQP